MWYRRSSRKEVEGTQCDAVEAEEVDEPEKRKPAVKASAVPAKKASSLASTVEEWDDE